MPVRLLRDGTYEFDTVAEAVEFSQMSLANGKVSGRAATKREAARQSGKRDLQGFLAGLAENQRAIINALKAGTLTGDVLAKKVDATTGSIGPMLRHLRNHAAEFGLDPEQVVVREKRKDSSGKPIVSAFKLGTELEGNI